MRIYIVRAHYDRQGFEIIGVWDKKEAAAAQMKTVMEQACYHYADVDCLMVELNTEVKQ